MNRRRWDVFAWFQAVVEAAADKDTKVRHSAVAVAVILQDYAHYGTPFGARPTVPTLARRTGLGESTVRQALASMEDAGLIVEVKRGGGTGDSARGTEYALTLNSATPEAEFSDSRLSDSQRATTNTATNTATNSATPIAPTEDTENTSSAPTERAHDADSQAPEATDDYDDLDPWDTPPVGAPDDWATSDEQQRRDAFVQQARDAISSTRGTTTTSRSAT